MRKAVLLLVLVPVLVLAFSAVTFAATMPEDLAQAIGEANLAIDQALAHAQAAAAAVDAQAPNADREYADIAHSLKKTTQQIVTEVKRLAAKYGIKLEFFKIEVQIGTHVVKIDPIHVAGD